MSSPSDPLGSALEALREATPPQPHSVQTEVWRRLAHTGSPLTPSALSWRQRIEMAFGNPAFATAFVAASLLLGLFLAEVRLNRLQDERSIALVQSYLQLIDPLLSATSLPRAQPNLQR